MRRKKKASNDGLVVIAVTLLGVAAILLYHSYHYRDVEHYSQYFTVREGRFPEVFKAQVVLETGNLSSSIWKENNNLVGMKCAQTRLTYCRGENRGHAKFDSPYDSIREYIFWQRKYLNLYENKHGPVQTNEEYLQFLLYAGYAEDEKYLEKLRKIIDN
jgi:flagellum-specific peptidoglycan hydrolase FlgJ